VKFRPRSAADAVEAKRMGRREAEYFILSNIVCNERE